MPTPPRKAVAATTGPTLRDLARRLGVSRTTVSLALNNHPRIPTATRERVVALARQLGYQPDARIARLMGYLRVRRRAPSRDVIAIIHAFPEPKPWLRNTHLRTAHESLHARATNLGFGAEDFWLGEPGMTAARLSGILRARGIVGLVTLPFPHFTAELDLQWDQFACAAIGHSLAVPLHRVAQNQYRDLLTSLATLRALGYRRPGLVLNPDVDQRVEHYFTAAYLLDQYQHRSPVERMEPLLFREGRTQFLRWFREQRPDAVLLAQPPPSQDEVRSWLAERDLECPRDFGLALLDVPHGPGKTSGIKQAYGPIASAAIDLVAGQVSRGERGLPVLPQAIKLAGEWRHGDTTRHQLPTS